MSIDRFIAELESSIDALEPGTLRPDTRFRDQPWWDSLAAFTTLAVFDSCFQRPLRSDDLARCHTIGDIHDLSKSP